MKESTKKTEWTESAAAEPFNEVIEHFQNVERMPQKPVELQSMPKPIRWFGYLFTGFVACGVLAVWIIHMIH